MKTSRLAIASAAVAMTFAAGAAQAGFMLAGTTSTPPFGTSVTVRTTNADVATVAVQNFSLSADSIVDAINLFGFSNNGSDVNVYIVEALGPEATESSIMGVALNAPMEQNQGVSNYHFIDIADMQLAAGSYFLVVTSSDSTGFQWRRVSSAGSINGGAGGSASFDADLEFVNQSYNFLTGSTNTFGFQILGSAIPAPGSVALMGVSGLLLAGRRRR